MGRRFKLRFQPYSAKIFNLPKKSSTGNKASNTGTKNVSLPENLRLSSSDSVILTPCSNSLETLPRELMFKILSRTSIKDLRILSQTSPKLRDAILAFLESTDYTKLMTDVLMKSPPSSMRLIYHQTGTLLKQATCILPTHKRLKIAEKFYALNGPPDLVSGKAIANCWGALIKAFVNGWEFNEIERVFKAVCHFGSHDEVGTLLNQFLQSEPGSNREAEKRLRTFYRSVFLEPHMNITSTEMFGDDFSFYLDLILREHSTYYQAKLLYLLFGPEEEGELLWNILTDHQVDHQSLYHVMGHAVCTLLKVPGDVKRSRSQPQLISLIEELTSFPDNWVLHNFASLMDSCGDSLLCALLSSRVINGHMREACEIFACLTVISVHNDLPIGNRLRLFVSVLRTIKNKSDQATLVQEMVKTHFRRFGNVLAAALHAPNPWEDELMALQIMFGEALQIACAHLLPNMEQ